MAIGDLFNLTLKSTYLGQECLNVFQYRQVSANESAGISDTQTLAQAFDDDVLPAIGNMLIDLVTLDEINVYNAFDPTDVYDTATLTPDQGAQVSGDIMSTFIVWEFRTTRVRRDIRRGYKRFTGLDESLLTATLPNAPMLTILIAVGDAMSALIEAGGISGAPIFEPVIVKRVEDVSSKGTKIYRLPETAEEMGTKYFRADYNYQRLSTQSSRKAF